MSRKTLNIDDIQNELEKGSSFFPSRTPVVQKAAPRTVKKKPVETHTSRQSISRAVNNPPPDTDPQEEAKKGVEEVKKEGSKEANKFTSKLVNISSDPPVNKVGYYLTRKEIDQLDTLLTKLKPIMRDQFNIRVTKNDIIRACLVKGIHDWEENQLASELAHLLTSK